MASVLSDTVVADTETSLSLPDPFTPLAAALDHIEDSVFETAWDGQPARLASLRDITDRKSADVKEIALRRVAEIDRKMEELRSMRAKLAHLADACHGDDRPDCPILNEFADGSEG
jgi:DNA-binding transcriptional MerR regulator